MIRLILAILLLPTICLAGPVQDAQRAVITAMQSSGDGGGGLPGATFFWRCEGTTLDATHDYAASGVDTTAAANGDVSLSGTAALVGSNGVLAAGTSDRYQFSSNTDLISPTVGSFGFLVQLDTISANTRVFVLSGSSSSYGMAVRVYAGIDFGLMINEEGTRTDLNLTGNNIAVDTTYGIVVRWDNNNDLLRLELYNSSGTLVESAERTSAWTAPANLTNATYGILVGNTGSPAGVTTYVDNVFISKNYDDPIEDYLFITSWTQVP
jgi:hypothetical protein